MKRDLATGQLPCNDNTAALLASYIVQGWSLLQSFYGNFLPKPIMPSSKSDFVCTKDLYYIVPNIVSDKQVF